MPQQTADAATDTQCLPRIKCPNCWNEFEPCDCVYISRHETLLGDPIVGDEAQMRFLPSRFSGNCMAVDPAGLTCHQLACPRCHLEIPRASLDFHPAFLSIVGAPGCGKSFLLGSMCWTMRKVLPRLGLLFTDADPTLNQVVHAYEQTLFLAEDPTKPVSIRKTELDGGDLYRSVQLGLHEMRLPRPFLFTIAAGQEGQRDARGRLLVLYDNAGEHFLPGSDATRAPVTEHLVQSAAILFVFDPTQDPRVRRLCSTDDPQVQHGTRPGQAGTAVRQETVMSEAAARIRKHLGRSPQRLHDRPLIVILAKADAWIHNLPDVDLSTEPFTTDPDGRMSLDMDRVRAVSGSCEAFIDAHCPELIAAARSFCSEVLFVPVSATGCHPELVEQDERQFYGVRPSSMRPQWVTVPLVRALDEVLVELGVKGG
ncbi:MAG: hypothetical protein MK101_09715 [Phycisphaerales bacterium]|nr:hypothetical protein [Phycisphaerales bacterium]